VIKFKSIPIAIVDKRKYKLLNLPKANKNLNLRLLLELVLDKHVTHLQTPFTYNDYIGFGV